MNILYILKLHVFVTIIAGRVKGKALYCTNVDIHILGTTYPFISIILLPLLKHSTMRKNITLPHEAGFILSHQRAAWNSSACSVSGGELYIPSVPEEEDRIKDLFYRHQVNAAWINIRSEYGPRWLN